MALPDEPSYNYTVNPDGSLSLTNPGTGESEGTYWGPYDTDENGRAHLGGGTHARGFDDVEEDGEGSGAGGEPDSEPTPWRAKRRDT